MTLSKGDIHSKHAVFAATLPGVVAVMPAFLLGAMGLFIRRDLEFGTAGLGALVSAFFLSSAGCAVYAGKFVEHTGAGRSLRIVCLGSGTALICISVLARGILTLVLSMLAAGAVNSLFQPASNLALHREVRRRRGLIFGIKQSGVPLCTLVAGLLVPLAAMRFGWRWAFAACGVLAYALTVLVPGRLGSRSCATMGSAEDGADTPTSPLVWLAVAAGCGTAGATAMASYLVEAGTDKGMPVALASGVLILGSGAGIVARLVVGAFGDRRPTWALPTVATMLALGGSGYALLSFEQAWLTLLGTLLAYACGWGWTGLLMFAVVQLNPASPATASGVIAAGAATGAAIGPLLFGLLATHHSFAMAWWASAVASIFASLLVRVAHGRFSSLLHREL